MEEVHQIDFKETVTEQFHNNVNSIYSASSKPHKTEFHDFPEH